MDRGVSGFNGDWEPGSRGGEWTPQIETAGDTWGVQMEGTYSHKDSGGGDPGKGWRNWGGGGGNSDFTWSGQPWGEQEERAIQGNVIPDNQVVQGTVVKWERSPGEQWQGQ